MPTGRKRTSIQRKLMLAILTGIAISSLVGISVSSWQEVQRFAAAKQLEVKTIAEVFAASVSEPLASRDQRQVFRSLSAISRFPSFIYARVADKKGRVIAELGSAVVLQTDTALPIYRRSRVQIVTNVISGGRAIGRVTLVAKASELKYQLLKNMLTGILAALAASLAGIYIAIRFQKRITAPLLNLTGALNRIRETQDFNHPVAMETDDETGQLVSAFNDMQRNIRQRDRRLAEHMENLEQTVEERTGELKVAKDVAEQANAAKSDFLATMSHEIRTPMNGMLVMAELLANAPLGGQNRRYADVIVRSGQSLLTIINDILDFSKIESGKLELEQVELSPAVAIDDILSLFSEKAGSKGLELVSYVDPKVPQLVAGDPVRLSQVVTNLVNNALKFTQSGHVLVEVLTRPSRSKADIAALEIAVSDTGIGIPQDKCATIFDAFSQADQSTTRNFGGTGLGLAICQRLVAAMGGDIEVSSKVGEGSRFYFHIDLPVLQPATDLALSGRLARAGIAASPALADTLRRYLACFDLPALILDPAEIDEDIVGDFDMLFADAAVLRRRGDAAAAEELQPYRVCLTPLGDNAYEPLIRDGLADEMLPTPVARDELMQLLQRLDEDRPRRSSLLEQQPSSGIDFASFKGAHVLVADDSAVNREVAIAALQRLDISCETVENGEEAVNAVAGGAHFDAVLMDCSMPVMDGFSATREIRRREELEGRARLPVIALTAHVAGLPAHDWRDAGMDDYLTKPFKLEELAQRLGNYLTTGSRSAADVALDNSDASAETVEPDMITLPAIDESVINSYAAFQDDGGAVLIARLFDLFLEHAPASFSQLESVSAGDDSEELAKAAHALKSMARNIGAVRLAQACGKLEADANAEAVADLSTALAEISRQLEQAKHRILEIAEERQLPQAQSA